MSVKLESPILFSTVIEFESDFYIILLDLYWLVWRRPRGGSWRLHVLGMKDDMEVYDPHIFREGNQPANRMTNHDMDDGYWPYPHPYEIGL